MEPSPEARHGVAKSRERSESGQADSRRSAMWVVQCVILNLCSFHHCSGQAGINFERYLQHRESLSTNQMVLSVHLHFDR